MSNKYDDDNTHVTHNIDTTSKYGIHLIQHLQIDIFLHNNYCNIDAISRHCWTVVCVCFFSFFSFFYIFLLFCIHLPRDQWIKIMKFLVEDKVSLQFLLQHDCEQNIWLFRGCTAQQNTQQVTQQQLEERRRHNVNKLAVSLGTVDLCSMHFTHETPETVAQTIARCFYYVISTRLMLLFQLISGVACTHAPSEASLHQPL